MCVSACVEALCECGASLSAVDKRGNTPFHLACLLVSIRPVLDLPTEEGWKAELI